MFSPCLKQIEISAGFTWTCWVTLMLRPVASVSSAWGRGAPRTSSSPRTASWGSRVSSSLSMIVSCLGATDNWPSVKQQRHLYKHQPIARYSVAVIIRYMTFATSMSGTEGTIFLIIKCSVTNSRVRLLLDFFATFKPKK